MSSPFEAPSSATSEADLEVLEQVHAELARARIPQFGLGGCAGLMGLVMGGFGLLLAGIGLVGGIAGGELEAMGVSLGMGFFYALFAAVYLVPGYLVFRAALALGGTGNAGDQLLEAARYHRLFWQVLGVLALGMMALYVVAVIGLVALGNSLNETFAEIEQGIEAPP